MLWFVRAERWKVSVSGSVVASLWYAVVAARACWRRIEEKASDRRQKQKMESGHDASRASTWHCYSGLCDAAWRMAVFAVNQQVSSRQQEQAGAVELGLAATATPHAGGRHMLRPASPRWR
jgi:hypothetical protein